MLTNEIRATFLEFFAEKYHQVVPSASLIPIDPTLLLTVAGMVPFKSYLLGEEEPPYLRVVSSQKCVRTEDIDLIGTTARHLSYFEMLGNFSFGDYFKETAIPLAYELITERFALDPDRLWFTVHESDDEAAEIWLDVVGIRPDRLQRRDRDNFWQMGDTGPCGPCSEIFVDLEWRPGDKPAELPQAEFEAQAEAGRFLEIWNLVFMQFDRQVDGELEPLPKPSVDTGAGLERIAAVLQDTDDNFHTDLFQPLLDRVSQLVGRPYPRSMEGGDRKSTRLNSSHTDIPRMPSSA